MSPNSHPDVGWAQAITYDSESDRVILQGGEHDDFTYEETWAYDYNSDIWTKMNPTTHPGPRATHSMDYDMLSDRCILFGGVNIGGYITQTGSEDRFNDTWIYDYNTDNWTELDLSTSPGQRAGFELVYNLKEDRTIENQSIATVCRACGYDDKVLS